MNAERKKEPYFGPDALKSLEHAYVQIDQQKNELLIKYADFKYANEKAKEYTYHGFLRRVGILNRCIHNIFSICPPDHVDRINDGRDYDISINLQAFVMNVFGCLDNIAWVWVYQRNMDLHKRKVGLKEVHREIRKSFSSEFRTYLESFDKWFEYIESYRDALAHRIPLYAPPFSLSPEEGELFNQLESQKWDALLAQNFDEHNRIANEQDSLGRYYPWMQHSFTEAKEPMQYHGQILADWNTIIELGEKFFAELKTRPQSNTRP